MGSASRQGEKHVKIIIVGAGIIGAVTAFRLAAAGAQVTVIEAGTPAGAASAASFGWVNASFYANRDHFNLRFASIDAHRRLADQLQSPATRWTGCLCWEEEGDAFDHQYNDLKSLGYDVQLVDRAAFQRLEPAVVPPERALRFGQEAVVDLPTLAHDALHAAMGMGAQLISGVSVTGIETLGGKVIGTRWSGGVIKGDRVVVCAGVATERLMGGVGVALPMLDRPGLVLRTAQMPPLVSHVLASPGQELRQEPDGRFLAPTSASHQGDQSDEIRQNPEDLAAMAAARVAGLLRREVRWEHVSLAARPVPQDGLPVMGHCGPAGLYAATMHSGATLAPLAAELVAAEVLETDLSNEQAALIAPYRPQRFTV